MDENLSKINSFYTVSCHSDERIANCSLFAFLMLKAHDGMTNVVASKYDASFEDLSHDERSPKGVSKKKPTGVVEHHEIGEMAHFLGVFGKSKEEAVKTLLASSLQIVGLEEVKKEYEGKWEAIEGRVGKAIEAFFTKKLRKIDSFVQLQEGRFALIFANMTREQGQARATQLSRELVNLLFGEMPGAELISVEAMVLDIDLSESLDDFNSLEEIIEHFQVAYAEAEKREEKQIKEVETVLTIAFRPAVNHRKKIISVSEIVPCRKTGKEISLLTDTDPIFTGSPHMRSELDLMVLKETGAHLIEIAEIKTKPVLLLSVSFETLANAYGRRKYIEIMNIFPDFTRKHLILNIEGITAGTPNSRYHQILQFIRPLVLGFSFEIENDWDDFHAISGLPVLAIGVAGNAPTDLPWIEDLFIRTHKAGKKCIWRNLEDDNLAKQAFKMGVDYVSGPVIGGVQNSPTRPFSIKS